jgi:hypothetical protein
MNKAKLQRFLLENPQIPGETEIMIFADHGQNPEYADTIQYETGYFEESEECGFVVLHEDDIESHSDEDLQKVLVIWS